jgi:hypothetical protein
MTDFVVTNVEGKTAPEIYKKAIEWIKITYKNPDKVILSTIENEYIRFEGSSDSFYSINIALMGKSYQQTKYQIEISIKDGRYKFDIIGMENYISPSQYSIGGWSDNVLFNGNLNFLLVFSENNSKTMVKSFAKSLKSPQPLNFFERFKKNAKESDIGHK